MSETKEDGFQKLSKFLGQQIAALNALRSDAVSESTELYLYRWMIEMRLTVQESAYFNYPHGKKWACLDVDGDVLGSGETAVKAIQTAHDFVDNPTDEESELRDSRRITEHDLDRADHLRDVEKDNRLTQEIGG